MAWPALNRYFVSAIWKSNLCSKLSFCHALYLKSQLWSLNSLSRLEDVKILIFELYVKRDCLDLVRFSCERESILDIICDA